MSDLYLCSPFRSFLSVNERYAVSSFNSFREVIDKAAKDLEGNEFFVDFNNNYSELKSRAEPLYNNLGDDNVQAGFQPLVTFDIDFIKIKSRLNPCLVDEISQWLVLDTLFSRISLFDNTVGILEVFVSPKHAWEELKEKDARVLDDLTTKFCIELVTVFNKLIDFFIGQLVFHQKKNNFFHEKKNFVTFKDVLGYSNPEKSRMLWVGRTIFYNDSRGEGSTEFINAWVGGLCIDGCSFNSGNNLVDGSYLKEDVFRSMVLCQYFNAAFSILNMNLDEINALEDKFEKEHNKISHIKRQVELFEIDEMSAKNGLQGGRRDICSKVFLAWHHDELKELVRKRLDLIKSRLREVHEKKISRYSSVMEALLAFLGAITLVDVCISLYLYTKVDYLGGPRWSVIELLKNTDPDILISLLVVVSALFGVFYVRKQRS